jgi:monoamine oxidase
MQRNNGRFYWAKVSRGPGEQMLQEARARWEPVYGDGVSSTVVLGASADWALWEWGPPLPAPPDGLERREAPKGAFCG